MRIFNIIKHLTSFSICDESHSEFMIKKLSVPFQFCYQAESATAMPVFLTVLWMPGSQAVFFTQSFATMFLCFSSFAWEDRDGSHRAAVGQGILYTLFCMWCHCPDSLFTNKTDSWLLTWPVSNSDSWPHCVQVFLLSCNKTFWK